MTTEQINALEVYKALMRIRARLEVAYNMLDGTKTSLIASVIYNALNELDAVIDVLMQTPHKGGVKN